MLFHQTPKKADAGTNTITIMIPVGATLKKVNTLNNTKAWQKTSIILTESSGTSGRGLSLLHQVPQPGARDLSWEGEIHIDPPFIYVNADFYGCDANDTLTMTVGYEMPAREPQRWW